MLSIFELVYQLSLSPRFIKGISPSSKLVSLADDTRVYSCINDIEKCDQLQIDLNSVYDWAHVNNMFLMPRNLIMYHLMVL